MALRIGGGGGSGFEFQWPYVPPPSCLVSASAPLPVSPPPALLAYLGQLWGPPSLHRVLLVCGLRADPGPRCSVVICRPPCPPPGNRCAPHQRFLLPTPSACLTKGKDIESTSKKTCSSAFPGNRETLYSLRLNQQAAKIFKAR